MTTYEISFDMTMYRTVSVAVTADTAEEAEAMVHDAFKRAGMGTIMTDLTDVPASLDVTYEGNNVVESIEITDVQEDD